MPSGVREIGVRHGRSSIRDASPPRAPHTSGGAVCQVRKHGCWHIAKLLSAVCHRPPPTDGTQQKEAKDRPGQGRSLGEAGVLVGGVSDRRSAVKSASERPSTGLPSFPTKICGEPSAGCLRLIRHGADNLSFVVNWQIGGHDCQSSTPLLTSRYNKGRNQGEPAARTADRDAPPPLSPT
jgi:hypothetical protein